MRVDTVSARSMTHLIGLLLDFYNVLLQFLAILDPRFGLEELFSLRIQYQKTGVGWESTKVHFNFAVTVHDCRPLDLVRVRVERKAQDMGETSFILQVTARVTSAADTDFIEPRGMTPWYSDESVRPPGRYVRA